MVGRVKDQMHDVVRAMNIDNFIIRKHREHVEIFNDRSNWESLDDEQVIVINERLSGLPSPDDDNEDARRFDLLILNLQLAMLSNRNTIEKYQIAVKEIASNLEEKSAIPQVAKQMELILAVQSDEYWQDVTLPILEELRRKLRDLFKFVEGKSKEDVYTDFEDTLFDGDIQQHDIVKKDPKLEDYHKRVKRFIRSNQGHITIRRLKNNEPISDQDIKALEEILFSEEGPIPREEYKNVFGERTIGHLVRSIVGLDRNAAKQAFADFLSKAPLNPEQISFLDEIVEYLVHNGTMKPKLMFEVPFIHFHDQGVVGIFGGKDASDVIEIVNTINQNADVA
jgi:type I restriction enzyme, R subunit